MLTQEQISARANGVGASEIAALLGISPFQSAFSVWQKKTGKDSYRPTTESQRWGNALEDVIRKEFAIQTRREILNPRKTYQHKKYPHMISSPDGIYKDGKGLVEIKTVSYDKRHEWGVPDTDQVPLYYKIQGLQQLAVHRSATGQLVEYVDFAALIGGNMLQTYRVHWDEEYDEALGLIIEEFWTNHVETGIPPEVDDWSPDRAKYLAFIYSQHGKDIIQEPNEDHDEYHDAKERFDTLEKYMYRLKRATMVRKLAEKKEDYWANKVREGIGDKLGVQTKYGVANWKCDKNGTRRFTVPRWKYDD